MQQDKRLFRTRQLVEEERMPKNLLNRLERSEYKLFEEDPVRNNTARKQAFTGIFNSTSLNQAFMSQKNMDLLQDQIRNRVYQSTGHLIAKQSDTELQIVMRSIYLQYGKNLPYNIKQQITQLNKLVLQETVPHIISGVEQYLSYLQRASSLPMPLQQPTNMSSAGRKTLPSVTTTFY